ncbi:tRNA3(Ser)-specific nuclease WapA precursor [bacterium BMS3Bbin05]|nr:tRNA3(Ser)-specific nuclease WapA precursor [bacterium BMS3Bbin05]
MVVWISLSGGPIIQKNICKTWIDFNGASCPEMGEDSWVGLGWTLHFGKLYVPVSLNPYGSLNPLIEMPDGSQHEAYLNAYASNYITKDYWILSDVNNTNKLTFADGRIIYFEYFGRTVTIGGSQYKEYYASNIEDTHGNSISIVYKDPSTNPSYLYGTIDYIKEKQNPYRQVTFLYTLVGGKYRLWKIKRPDSKYIVFSYTNQSSYNRVLLTKVQPPVGNAWQYAYDTSGSLFELTKFTMPYNGTITYTYGTSGLTYGGGKFKNFRVVKKKVTGGTDIHSGTWNFSYFQGTDNEYTIITDPCNRTIKYRHYGYNSGLSNGNIWKLGLIRSKEIVGQETTTYAWTNSSLISYDDYVVSTWRDDAIYVPFMASQAIVRDGMTYTTSYSSYDNYGNPKVVTETGDKTRMRSLTYWYSTAKNIVKYKIKTETVRGSYPGTFTTTYTYDSNTGDVTSIDRYGVQTWFTYYLNGNLKTEKDANYKMTTYYWNNGRVSKVVTPEFTVNRSINVIGTVAWQDDGRGNKTYYSYDGASNRTSMDNYSASIDYTYDSDNRLIKKVENIAGKTYTTQYTYDGNDNITDVYYPSGTQVHYAYNSNNQVTAVTGFGGSIINITYCTTGSCIGLPMSFTTSNGLTINLTYNNRNLTTQIKVGTSSLDIGYSYDGRGNVISITNNLDGTRSQSYEYDSLNRLITFNAGGLWGTGELTYDSLGNRKSKKIGNNPTSYYYSSNRLNYTTGNEPYDFSYNADGDMTSIDMQGFVYNLQYDRLHNLTSFLHNGVPLAKFTYDGDGLRVTKTSTDGDITVYHYDQSGNVISETDENGRLITDYVYLFDKLAVKILPMPHIVVSPGSYNFGDVYVNTAATTSITVQNSSTGTGELHLGTVTVDPSEFSIQADNCSGQTLLYGQSCSINIQFLPTAVESQNANLNIPSDDPDFHVKTVPLSGNGVLPILTILKGGDGFGDGAIVSTPMGIDCGADCSESYITGTVVALTAAHNVDSSFSGWSGGGCAGTGTCVVTMNADTEVTANFNVLPPLADFTSSAISGYTPAFTVNFIDASLRAHTWQWDFGDGSLSSTLQNPSHTYTSAGIYTVTLTVTNPSGQDKMVKTNYITVAPCPNKVRIVHADRSTTNYSTVQSAYDAAKNGETIQTQGIVFSENLNIYKDILVSIEGGYDCNYSTVVGKTSTIGNVSISAGTVHIGNFIISQ